LVKTVVVKLYSGDMDR